MPRWLPINTNKIIGNLFIFVVISVLAFIYVTFVVLIWGPWSIQSPYASVILFFYHIISLFLIWSLLTTMFTDPGQVPAFWGFHFGDHESKRKRYCLMCNVFKPERCHHCSTCGRCVLNMDHHCPWVNNCIGFWNRKPFILLLVYVLLISYYSCVFFLIDIVPWVRVEYEWF